MALLPKSYSGSSKLAVTALVLISSLIFLPSRSVGLDHEFGSNYYDRKWAQEKEKEKELGSRPPGCVNKCMNCRPCIATLVIPPHHDRKGFIILSHRGDQDGSYYLLSWRCRCGNKLYKP